MTHWLRPTDVCVVTGGCNGLGAAILKRLAAAGCPTVALDIAVPSDEEAKPPGKTTKDLTTSAPEAPVTADIANKANSTKTQIKGEVIGGNKMPIEEANSEVTISEDTTSTNPHPSGIISDKSNVDAPNSKPITDDGESLDQQVGKDSAASTKEELKPTLTIKCDVRSQKDLAHARDLIFEKFQRYPSVLICNAGVRHPLNSIALTNFEDIEETIEVNLAGPLKCIRTFLPHIIEANRGYIVTIGSALGLICPKGLSVYGASKAGILGFHEALEQDISSYKDIHALLVCPGQIDTSMFADVKTPSETLAPIVEPDKLARKIVKRITKAKTATVYAPAYVRYLSLVRAVPTPLANMARKWSGVDKVYDDMLKERQKAEAANNFKVPEYVPEIETPGSVSEKSSDRSEGPQALEAEKGSQTSKPKEPQTFVTKTHGAEKEQHVTTKDNAAFAHRICSHPRRNWFRSTFASHGHPESQNNISSCDGYVDVQNTANEDIRNDNSAHHDNNNRRQNDTNNGHDGA